MTRLPFVLTLGILVASVAGPCLAAPSDDPAYVRVTEERAAKIVAALALESPPQRERVQAIVAQHYRDLQRAELEAAAAKKTAEAQGEVALEAVRTSARAAVADLHYAFVGKLAAELTPSQVEQVKDGLTYGVVPLTYRVYQELLPGLTEEQKRQILAWLVEAREHAMDAGSSEEKHRWFGKYKGRINNYLAAAGIDMKQAERELQARKKAAQP